MDTLFTMPPKKFVGRKPRGKWSQQERCRRCASSASDSDGAYCDKFDLCLEFEDGKALLTKNGCAITCDGREWSY